MAIKVVAIQRIENDTVQLVNDQVIVEEPLEIRLEYWLDGKLRRKQLAITMRTPGDDRALATGFLWAEGIIARPQAIAGFHQHDNLLTVTLERSIEPQLAHVERNFYLSASCGVCGKASIEALHQQCSVLPDTGFALIPAIIQQLPSRLRTQQSDFGRTGGVHAAGVFNSAGELLDIAEDVGRHNALDKLLGRQILADNLPLREKIVLLSGRISFELVQKAIMAGVPVLAAVGAPSSLAIELAQTFNLTLIGFVREQRFNVYCGI